MLNSITCIIYGKLLKSYMSNLELFMYLPSVIVTNHLLACLRATRRVRQLAQGFKAPLYPKPEIEPLTFG